MNDVSERTSLGGLCIQLEVWRIHDHCIKLHCLTCRSKECVLTDSREIREDEVVLNYSVAHIMTCLAQDQLTVLHGLFKKGMDLYVGIEECEVELARWPESYESFADCGR